MNKPLLAAYACLDKVFRQNAFSGIELNETLAALKASERALVTKIVYGVLDQNVTLEYLISHFAASIRPAAKTVLKIGFYCLDNIASMPVYTTVNDCCDLAKQSGKLHTVGFVNSTLRAYIAKKAIGGVALPASGSAEFLSVRYSFPLWATAKLVKQYGYAQAEKMLAAPPFDLTHLRVNLQKCSFSGLLKYLDEHQIPHFESLARDGVYISGSPIPVVRDKMAFIMSAGSMLIAESLGAGTAEDSENVANAVGTAPKILDVCAAPGGKSVYLSALCPAAQITSCDLHPHRVRLLEQYAAAANARNITARVQDATQFCSEFESAFDFVLADVPCSGFGVYRAKPDIKLKAEKIIGELCRLQLQILQNAARYVKIGGTLLYSTCTVFNEENGGIIAKFLRQNTDFAPENISLPYFEPTAQKQLLPNAACPDGVFMAKLRRKK